MNSFKRFSDDAADGAQIAIRSFLRDAEDLFLRARKDVRCALSLAVGVGNRLVRRPDEISKKRLLFYDGGVTGSIGDEPYARRKMREVFDAAHALELAALRERIGKRDEIHRTSRIVDRENALIDISVRRHVKIFCVKDLHDIEDHFPFEHHRAEDGFLRLDIMRRDTADGFNHG